MSEEETKRALLQALRDCKADIAKVWTVLDDLELTTSETENARNILGLRMHAIDREIDKAEGRMGGYETPRPLGK